RRGSAVRSAARSGLSAAGGLSATVPPPAWPLVGLFWVAAGPYVAANRSAESPVRGRSIVATASETSTGTVVSCRVNWGDGASAGVLSGWDAVPLRGRIPSLATGVAAVGRNGRTDGVATSSGGASCSSRLRAAAAVAGLATDTAEPPDTAEPGEPAEPAEPADTVEPEAGGAGRTAFAGGR